jgi:hypothetical protein
MINTFKLDRSIAQYTISNIKKETTTKTTKRHNHNEIGNSNGNNSESKDCCSNLMDLTGQKVEMDNRIPIIRVLT